MQVSDPSVPPSDTTRNRRALTCFPPCRVRKVKCDEAKPCCERCTSTGRTCDGYKVPPPPKKRARQSKYSIVPDCDKARRVTPRENLEVDSELLMLLVKTPPDVSSRSSPITTLLSDITGDRDERRCFQYFRHQAVDNISGYFELAFWDHLVLQASYTEPCVRYALLALSSLHESYETISLEPQSSAGEKAKTLRRLALKQYTRAVRLLANNLSTEQPPLQVILISCLIFIWIEFLQDNLETGLGHLKSGLQLLNELRNSPHPYCVDESVIQLFTRLHTQVTVHGMSSFDPNASNSPTPLTVLSDIPPAFRDALEARNSLDNELAGIFRFHRQTESPAFVQYQLAHHPFPDPLSLRAICQSHLHNLQKWQTAFLQTNIHSTADKGEKQSIALVQLQIQYLLVVNTLQTLFTTSQMIYDDFHADFERMLSLAESLVLRTKRKFFVFAFDTGALAPLFYLILKCRDLGLRRKAIDLLKQAPPREGMWQRESVIDIAEWKILKEEQGRGGLPPTSKLPNCARIYAEGATEKVVGGRMVTVLRYRRGAAHLDGNDTFEEEVTNLSARLAGMIGTG